MKRLFFFLCLWSICACGAEYDFDYIVVGTTPIAMFEAIYRKCLGNNVLVVERASECGGAWKSISICGVDHADLGCHEFGTDNRIRSFLEEYAGCNMVTLSPPNQRGRNTNYYPSKGCFELVHNLERLMEALDIPLMIESPLESVYIDKLNKKAIVNVAGNRFSTSKVLITQASEFALENTLGDVPSKIPHRRKFPHVYLLINDATPARFSYIQPSISGVSRAMNLTDFVGLDGSGKQLITFQVHNEQSFQSGQKYINELKRLNLINSSAELIEMQNYVYEQSVLESRKGFIPGPFFELIDSSNFSNLTCHIEKWKKAMRPWKEIMNASSP